MLNLYLKNFQSRNRPNIYRLPVDRLLLFNLNISAFYFCFLVKHMYYYNWNREIIHILNVRVNKCSKNNYPKEEDYFRFECILISLDKALTFSPLSIIFLSSAQVLTKKIFNDVKNFFHNHFINFEQIFWAGSILHKNN